MTQPRMNLYGFPHKGLRNAISQFSLAAGSANFSDPGSLGALTEIAAEVFMLLELHAHSEESVVLPALEAKVPGSTADNIAEHVQLENEIDALVKQFEGIARNPKPGADARFYANLANFHSRYLAHMAMEEDKMNELIWANFTDEELMVLHGQVMAALRPEQVLIWFKYIVPALNQFERTVIMGGLKANAPAPFFESALAMLSGVMSADEHHALASALQ